MKKITFLILMFSSIASFSQEQVILDIYLLLNNNGNGSLTVSNSSGQVLYSNYGSPVNSYSMILNLSTSGFPLTLAWRPGLSNGGCTIPQNLTYSYSDYTNGTTLSGGCAPEYFYIKSPHIHHLTAETSTKGVCENINISYLAQYYSASGNPPFLPCPTPYSAQILFGSTYRGPLHIISDIESTYGNPKVIMKSKVATFNIIGCSPALDGQPIPEKTRCKFESSGTAVIKFKTDLITGEKFLFNIFKNGVFDKSAFVAKEQIINKSYTFTGFAEGSYYIKYQSQAIGDGTTMITASTAITTDSFDIESPAALTSTITDLQPECFNGQGAIQISASGGTLPYYYKINTDPEVQFTTAVTIPKYSGNYTIIVRDSQNCINTSAND